MGKFGCCYLFLLGFFCVGGKLSRVRHGPGSVKTESANLAFGFFMG